MSYLIIKNECDNDYVSPGLFAIEMTEKFQQLLREIDYPAWGEKVKFCGYDISEFGPMYLVDNLGECGDFLSDFLLNDVVEDWIVIDDLPSGLPLLEDAVVNAMQVDYSGGVTFLGYGDDGDEIYTLAIHVDDLLDKTPVEINWDEYLKGDSDGQE